MAAKGCSITRERPERTPPFLIPGETLNRKEMAMAVTVTHMTHLISSQLVISEIEALKGKLATLEALKARLLAEEAEKVPMEITTGFRS